MQQVALQIYDEWKTIPNHTRYEISIFGDVRHIRHQRILKQSYPYNKYPQVNILNDSKNKTISTCVHHLMALTWLGEKPKGYEIDHIDKDRSNNNLSNLSYLPWRKNRNPRRTPILYCVVCGKELKKGSAKYCSKRCQYLANRTLVQCIYCGKEFYRRNSVIRGCNPKRGYGQGRIFCSQACHAAEHKRLKALSTPNTKHGIY